MDIEIGKTYQITNKFKKTVQDTMFFEKEREWVMMERVWRSATYHVTPVDQCEVDMLVNHLEGKSEVLEISGFEQYEMWDEYDQCYFEVKCPDDWPVAKQEEFEENYYDEGFMFLEDEGWIEHPPEIFIEGEILIEVIE